MLTESILVSCSLSPQTRKKSTNPTPALKDASLAIHSLPPQANVKQIFKKSSAATNGVAASDEHIFVVQADKAIINVYSRERGNQECLIPFQERVTALALTCNGTIIVLGTESGRLMLWETPTGRLVSTSPTHLQAVTCLAVSGDSSFIISGSADSSLHTWSSSNLLSFDAKSDGRSPIASMTSHRAAVTALAVSSIPGPGSVAVSGAADGTVIVFDYVNGEMLRTFILIDPPAALVMDPADRGFFVGHQDGSVQLVDFLDEALRTPSSGTSAMNLLHTPDAKMTPLQPPASSRWHASAAPTSAASAVLSLTLSWDGMTLISGHADGQVSAWNVGQRSWQSALLTMAGPVTNVMALPPEGWSHSAVTHKRHIRLDKVVKPKFEAQGEQRGLGQPPANYNFSAQLIGGIEDEGYLSSDIPHASKQSDFERALTCESGFPQDMLQDSLSELALWKQQANGPAYPSTAQSTGGRATAAESEDFMPLDETEGTNQGAISKKSKASPVPKLSLADQNTLLRKQLAALQRVQRVTFRQLDDLREQRDANLARLKTLEVDGSSMALDEGASDELTAAAADFVQAEEDAASELRREDTSDTG